MRPFFHLFGIAAMITIAAPVLAAQQPGQPPAAGDTGTVVAPAPCTFAACALRIESRFWEKSLVRGEQEQVVARLGWPRSPHIEHVFEGSAPAAEHAARYARSEGINGMLTVAGAIAFGLGVAQDRPLNGLSVGGIALLLASAPHERAANLHLARAVASYNADLPQQPPNR